MNLIMSENFKKAKKRPKTHIFGIEVRSFSEITSTNDVAKELARSGAEEGAVVVAEVQTHGKGRLGRSWLSPKGGVWFSVILRPKVKAKEVFKITFLTAVAVARVVKELFKLDAEIEWPNDVLIDGKKVCGILTETNVHGEIADSVVIGVGINANVDVNTFPKDLSKMATSIVAEAKIEIDQERLLQALLEEMETYYVFFKEGKFDLILDEWKRLNRFFGASVEVLNFSEKFVGQALNVDKDGALIIRLADGSMRKVVSGDISLLSKEG